MSPERRLEARLVALCKQHDLLCYKFVSPNRRGVPDRILISRFGLVCFLELKAPGKKADPLQQRELNRIRRRFVKAECVNNEVELTALVQHVADYIP
jgi:hypothetical protein